MKQEKNFRHGHLMIIGGGEDRKHDKNILARFVKLAGGPDKKFVVVTAASKLPEELWQIYESAFIDLGVKRCSHLQVVTRADANDEHLISSLHDADGIFMTGGDQKRLLAVIGGTRLDNCMHLALKQRGACIAGTSAGASAMSGHMLADGKAELQPEKGSVNLGAGLGLLVRVVIDQHFSQRHRIPRLLTAVAQNPYLFGIGIDENTALVVERGTGIEVIGEGTVTIIDGRNMISDIADRRSGECPAMIDVRLHLLPAGSRYCCAPEHAASVDAVCGIDGAAHDYPAPPALTEFLNILTRETVFDENY